MSTLLVDANNLAMRSIHAMSRSGLSADGISTGPLLVFVNSLSRHTREEHPDRVAVCWDSGVSAFRTAIDPAYKAHRAKVSEDFDETKRTMFSLMKEFLAVANIHQVERPGFEADDLIATYCHQAPPEEQVVILSSDKDFLQLLSPKVEQVRLSSGGAETDRWTMDRVREEWGCEPGQLALAMSLAGDASDGIPGVPGFGMVTAIKTLAKANWSLEAIDHPKVEAHREQVDKALQLVDLREPRRELVLPAVPSFSPTVPGNALFEDLIQFLVRYRMDSIKARAYSAALWKEPS